MENFIALLVLSGMAVSFIKKNSSSVTERKPETIFFSSELTSEESLTEVKMNSGGYLLNC